MLWIFNPIMLLLLYIAYTWLYEARGKRKWLTAIYWPVLVVGAVVDVVVNVTWFTVIFWDRPREFLLTQRVERLKSKGGYRGWLAKHLCRLMNHFQPGHCL
jgi:hypothetical protein